MYDDFAFVWRRGARLSPATQAFVSAVEHRFSTLGETLDGVPRRRAPQTAA
jgi:hypothetical protein